MWEALGIVEDMVGKLSHAKRVCLHFSFAESEARC